MPRNLLAFMFGMKKCLIILLFFALPVIQAQAADLRDQLPGFWRPDMTKTLALAKKANREMDIMTQAMVGKLVFEFQKDKMIVHFPPGFSSNKPPVPYTVKVVDKTTESLILNAAGKEMTVRFRDGQLALNDSEQGWTVFNRMSKEDFAKWEGGGAKKEAVGGEATGAGKLEDVSSQPIPDNLAAGEIHGKEFKVEQATLKNNELKLRQGGSFFADLQFAILPLGKRGENLDGKKFLVEPKHAQHAPHIRMDYIVEGKRIPENEIFTNKYTMRLEFGNAKDGKIPGKIHLRLPDKAGSFVIGTFEADTK